MRVESGDAVLRTAGILRFRDPVPAGEDARMLLGGKGAGLVDMVRDLGLPVPPGFVVTTGVCRGYLASGWPEGLDAALARAMGDLGTEVGGTYGDARAPLLVSVRSGAPVSMPGMMDTLLNVGITPAIVTALGEATGDPAFAADCWLRFHRMCAETVVGLPRDAAGAAAVHDDSAASRLAAADRIARLCEEAGAPVPHDPWQQLRDAVETVFRSWTSERARLFRAREGIAEDLGTAVVVQAMVFGNRDERSGTGVLFSRDPSTGEALPLGDYLPCAQGEDVVAGTHAVHGLAALRDQLPAVHAELTAAVQRLEHHYRDMCDVEFTVSSGRLYLLQTRVGRRAPLAAARIAVEMAEDPGFPLDRAGAVERIGPEILAQLAGSTHVDPAAVPVGRGLAASPGVGVGALCCDADRAAELAADGVAVVLAREDTSPEDVHGMVNAAAIVTLRGGVVSHAAVVARSWSIPAVTSLAEAQMRTGGLAVQGRWIAEGEVVTVDGTHGAIYTGDCRQAGEADVPWARTIREWAAALGVEPGSRAAAAPATDGGEVGLYALVRTVQLKGLCPPARAAGCLEAAEEAVQRCVAAHPALFKETARGLMLTPEGRAFAAGELESERAGLRGLLEVQFSAFLPLNARFKALVTWWQTEGQSQGEAGFDRLCADLRDLHGAFLPVVMATGERAPRLAGFAARFDRALAAIAGGDLSMVASPLKESYHTVWFDFHEELIALSGRSRTEADA